MRYAELQVTTHYSFLRGASSPEELFASAALLGIEAVAVVDRNSLAGLVRAHDAAKATGIRLVVGCRLDHQDLVTADAEAAIGQPLQQRRARPERRAGRIDDDEIVASAMHLGERELHPCIVTAPIWRGCIGTHAARGDQGLPAKTAGQGPQTGTGMSRARDRSEPRRTVHVARTDRPAAHT